MIAVEVREDHVAVTGHAGYAERGKDIVCAAVSVLFQNMCNSIQAFTGDRVRIRMDPGDSRIDFEELAEGGKLLVDSFFCGICAIADEYPEYVEIR